MNVLLIDHNQARRTHIRKRICDVRTDRLNITDAKSVYGSGKSFLATDKYDLIFIHCSEHQEKVIQFFAANCRDKFVVAYSAGVPIKPAEWNENQHFSFENIPNGTEQEFPIETIIWQMLENGAIDGSTFELIEQTRRRLHRLLLIEHSVAYELLALDIDLIGTDETLNDDNKTAGGDAPPGSIVENNAVAYLAAFLSEKRSAVVDNESTYYRQMLSNVWHLIAGKYVVIDHDLCIEANMVDGTRGKMLCVGPRQEIMEDQGKSVMALTDEIEAFPDLLTTRDSLCALVGLKPQDKDRRLVIDPTGAILRFMCLLDSLVSMNDINSDTLGYVLCFEPLRERLSLEKRTESTMASPYFHSWFCALMEGLEQLRRLCSDRKA